MWFLLAVISYFLFSAVVVLDKYFLEKPIQNPKIYLFYTSIGSLFFIIFIPFGFNIPPLPILALNFFASGFFILSLYFLYYSFKLDEASKVISSIGGFTAAFIYILNYAIFHQTARWKNFDLKLDKGIPLDSIKILGIFFLILGALLIIANFTKIKKQYHAKTQEKEFTLTMSWKLIITVLTTSICSALFFVFVKLAYASQSFISAFIWVKLGILLFGLLLLFSKKIREQIKPVFKRLNRKRPNASFSGTALFISKLMIGGLANILQHFATALAPLKNVSLIKSLEGTEYIFVFAFAYFLSKKYPRVLKEKIKPEFLVQKIAGVFIIAVGIVILNI